MITKTHICQEIHSHHISLTFTIKLDLKHFKRKSLVKKVTDMNLSALQTRKAEDWTDCAISLMLDYS